MKWIDIDPYFDKIISSEEIKSEKPDIEFFKKCIEMSGVEKEGTVYVGDDPEKDIIPASKVGLKTILYKTEEHKPTSWRRYNTQAKPNAVIKKISDIKKIIF